MIRRDYAVFLARQWLGGRPRPHGQLVTICHRSVCMFICSANGEWRRLASGGVRVGFSHSNGTGGDTIFPITPVSQHTVTFLLRQSSPNCAYFFYRFLLREVVSISRWCIMRIPSSSSSSCHQHKKEDPDRALQANLFLQKVRSRRPICVKEVFFLVASHLFTFGGIRMKG